MRAILSKPRHFANILFTNNDHSYAVFPLFSVTVRCIVAARLRTSSSFHVHNTLRLEGVHSPIATMQPAIASGWLLTQLCAQRLSKVIVCWVCIGLKVATKPSESCFRYVGSSDFPSIFGFTCIELKYERAQGLIQLR